MPDRCVFPDIPGYRIVRELGRGGMGATFLAQHTESGEFRAIKTVSAITGGRLSAMYREIRILAELRHPGIVTILDRGESRGAPWYAMEYIDGDLLYDHLGYRPPDTPGAWWDPPNGPAGRRGISGHTLNRIVSLVRRICKPLAYLHSNGLVHKDIKPGNIMVRKDGRPVIVDFGLTVQCAAGNRREILQEIIRAAGVARYMAPELHGSGEGFLDARVDIFALGAILCELLTGMVPSEISGRTSPENNGTAPGKVVEGIPREIDDLVAAMTDGDPGRRIGYVEDIATRLAGKPPVIHNRSPAAGIYLHRPRFAGRKSTLDRLDSAIARTFVGKSRIFFIGGESGIGKTRLAQELITRSRQAGFMTLMGECRWTPAKKKGNGGEAVLLGAFRRPLRTIVNAARISGDTDIGRALEETAPTVSMYHPLIRSIYADDSPSPPPGADHRKRLFSDLYRLLTVVSRKKPVLLVIDDLQWADPHTLAFLQWMTDTRDPGRVRLSVLGLFRSGEVTPGIRRLMDGGRSETIMLDRLTNMDVQAIVSDMLASRKTDSVLLERLGEVADGNPFHVSEYLLACVEDRLLVRENAGGWRLNASRAVRTWPGYPSSLKALIAARLERLDGRARKLVDICACIGREIPVELVESLRGSTRESWDDARSELVIRQLLQESAPGTLRFFHDKLRETAYETMEPRRRKRIHRRLAGRLESRFSRWVDEDPVMVGKHWENAGEPLRAARYYELGAVRYLKRYAVREADELLVKCIAFTRNEPSENIRLRILRARNVFLDNGRYEDALGEYRRAMKDAVTHALIRLQADGLTGLMETYGRIGEFDKADAAGMEAMNLFRRAGDFAGVARIHGNLAMNISRQGRFREAIRHYRLAERLYRRRKDAERLAWVRINMALTHFSLYETEKSIAILETIHEESMDGGDRIYDVRALSNLASIYLIIGELDLAETYLDLAMKLDAEMGNRQSEGANRVKRGRLLLMTGRLTEAIRELERAEPVNRDFNDRYSLGSNFLARGMAYDFQGDFDAALAFFRRAREMFDALNYSPMVAECIYKITRTMIRRNAGSDAVVRCGKLVEMARDLGDREFLMDCLVLACVCCDAAEDMAGLERFRGEIGRFLQSSDAREIDGLKMGILLDAAGRRMEALAVLQREFHRCAGNPAWVWSSETVLLYCALRRTCGEPVGDHLGLLNTLRKRIRREGSNLYEPEWCVERGYVALAAGKSGHYWRNHAVAAAGKMGLGPSSPVMRKIAAFRAACPDRAFRRASDGE